MGDRAAPWLAGGIMAVVGVVFAGVGGKGLLAERAFEQDTVVVTGRVVGLEPASDGTGVAPVVEYAQPVCPKCGSIDARPLQGKVFSNPPDYSVGDTVPVIVSRENGAAKLDTFTERYLFSTIFGGIGLLSASIGLGVLARSFRRWRSRNDSPPGDLPLGQRLQRPPPDRPGSFPLAFAAVLVPMGLAFLAGGLWSLQRTRAFVARSVPAVGVIVGERKWHSDYHSPVIEVRRGALEPLRFDADLTDWNVGDEVGVRYVEQPPEARVDRFADLYLVPTIFTSLGGLLTLGGFALVVVGLRARNRAVSLLDQG